MTLGYAPLRAGDLNQRVVIEEEVRTPNGQGGWTTSWIELGGAGNGKVWAELLPLNGDEAMRSLVERSRQWWRVTIRFRSGITTKHRLRAGALILNIRSAADPFGRRDRIVMRCESGAPT